MCDTIRHRGPDDGGLYGAPHVVLGQRRLAIIDLDHGACAPLANEDGSIWVVFNGEIYNFADLRTQLQGRGHIFRTKTDTEVLVHLYEDFGPSCVDLLDGMFAFAIWDEHRQCLFAARDRLGKKPFMYALTPSGLVFGSELKAVLADPSVPRDPDFHAIDAYLTRQYVPSPQTAFAGIRKLPAAHTLLWTVTGELQVRRYWEPPAFASSALSEPELHDELLCHLRTAVRRRMVADVPVGAFLSGGIDSGTVVALMAQESSQPIKTFSIGFTHESFNELPFARLVAERYGTDHHEVVLEASVVDELPRLVYHYNEPFADSSALPTYYISKVARAQVTVALSGDGGDESFAGYTRYADVLRWSRADRIPVSARRALAWSARPLAAVIPHQITRERVRRLSSMFAAALPERYSIQTAIVKAEEKARLYTGAFRHALAAGPLDGKAVSPSPVVGDPVDWAMRYDLGHYLPDCMAVKVDIASMANSLEVRSPFMDHRLVEFATTIPRVLKRDRLGGKRILRHVAAALLPEALFDKPKTGFSVPLAQWLRADLRVMMQDVLLSDLMRSRGYFEPSVLHRMVNEHLSGRRDWSNRLWALLFLELWWREFLD